MHEIIPAVIPKNFSDLQTKLGLVAGFVPVVQIDICDGKFTPDKTWPHKGNPDPDFLKIIKEEEGFPFWEELDFEFHLMVADPVAEYSQWISAGAKRVIVHVEAFPDAAHLLQFAVKFKEEYGGDGSFLATGLGVAINIETDLAVLDPILEYVDFVQCMGIKNIGYQGNPFDNAVLERIRTLKQKKPELVISVDGGITVENAREIINAGAQRLIVGSAIFNSDDIPATIEEFENL